MLCSSGVHPAFEFVKSCLEAGKSVSTSNKQLVAEKGDILLQIAKAHNVNFFFEASVGGAIPILRPLHTCLAGNDITAVAGILNGTTNFILNKMIRDKMSFSDALTLAQEKGYAERNPAADVEGHDACRKICILSSLIFGRHVYPEHVYTKGIETITLEDVELANTSDRYADARSVQQSAAPCKRCVQCRYGMGRRIRSDHVLRQRRRKASDCQRCIGGYHRFCKGKWNRHCTVLGFCFR